MGLLDSGVTQSPADNSFSPPSSVVIPNFVGHDFPEGLVLTEYINGAPVEETKIALKGTFGPHGELEFGGTQEVVSTTYPGSKVKSIQVMGPSENDIPIKGRLKTKFMRGNAQMSNYRTRLLAEKMQEDLDAMRERGNLVQLQLGEFTRWGIIKEGKFMMRTRAEIGYEITFFVQSKDFPDIGRFTPRPNDDVEGPNFEITTAAEEFVDEDLDFPEEMPKTTAEQITDMVNDVALAVKEVTDFVDATLTNGEQIEASIERAIGLIKYARTTIAISKRRLGKLSNSPNALASSIISSAQAIGVIEGIVHINTTRSHFTSMSSFLAGLQAKFAALRSTIPLFRHKVVDGDTLQKLAVKFYNNADNWTKIYDHNKLTSTELVRGAILEIPRL